VKGGISKEGQHGGRRYFSRGRGRARGGEVRCCACGKLGHKSWECLERNKEGRVLHIIFIIPMTINDVNLYVSFGGVSGLSS
jgi:hypothetical protein